MESSLKIIQLEIEALMQVYGRFHRNNKGPKNIDISGNPAQNFMVGRKKISFSASLLDRVF
jgi:hypothetical protein